MLSRPWPEGTPGLLHLPSGLVVRGRGRRAGLPAGPPPEFGVYPAARPVTEPWPGTWIRWPDFRTPSDPAAARAAIADLYARLGTQRCEVACGGGVGRTGTVLAALAVLDGLDAEAAVRWVRARYHRRAVETPGQRRWLKTLA